MTPTLDALVTRVRQAVETKNALSLYWFQSDILALCQAVSALQGELAQADKSLARMLEKVAEAVSERDAAQDALRQVGRLRLLVDCYDGRAFDKAEALRILDQAEAALGQPAEPQP